MRERRDIDRPDRTRREFRLRRRDQLENAEYDGRGRENFDYFFVFCLLQRFPPENRWKNFEPRPIVGATLYNKRDSKFFASKGV
jgi:hypothetical protein